MTKPLVRIMATKKLIVIAGATATGKTDAAIALAKKLNTEIISADSRQCYREMDIGVAAPTPAQLQDVPHHFIKSHSVQDSVTAVTFEQYALQKLDEIFAGNDHAVVCGGTGLYIRALCEGLNEIPAIGAGLRKEIIERYEENGLSWLHEQLEKYDPAILLSTEAKNPQRMMRALEVVKGTGQSIRSFQSGNKKERPFQILKFHLAVPREELNERINRRVDLMMDAGLLAEVKKLHAIQHLPALRTVGYSELFDFLKGDISLPQAVEEIKKNTRHYAKRQMTWFKKDGEMMITSPQNIVDKILSTI